MENKIFSDSHKNLDSVLFENSKVCVTKSNSFEILMHEEDETCGNLFVNMASIKITSR